MKKLMTLMGLAALSFSAFALTTNKVGFEESENYTADDTTVATKLDTLFGETENAHVWYGASDDASVVKTYEDAGVTPYTYTTTSLVADGPGDQFLSVEASSAPLVRSLANYPADGEPVAQTLTGDVVADTLVQFTASEEMQTVDSADGTKFALWLYADPEGATNLYVTAGSYAPNGGTYDVSATNFTLATSAEVLPNTWHRVTIRAINGIFPGVQSNWGMGFVVYVDGVVATCSDEDYAAKVGGVDNDITLEAKVLKANAQLFLSMVVDSNANKLTGVGFKGTGLIDDLSIVSKSDAPSFVNAEKFVITWDENVVSFTVGGTTYTTADKTYVVVTPVNGVVTLTDVVYAEGYVAGEWTANGASVENSTFTLGQGVDFADGMIVSAAESVTSPFIINGEPASGTIATLADAIDALGNEGGTIALAEDYVMAGALEWNPDSNVEIVLDLQGHVISGDAEYQFVVSVGSLNIIDTVGGGSVVVSHTAFYIESNGEVIIGNDTTDQGVIVDGTICDSETEGLSIVLGKFTSEEKPAAAYIAEGSVCSEQMADGYWVVEPGATYTFTVAAIEHTTVNYLVGGLGGDEGSVAGAIEGLAAGTTIVVTYTPETYYEFTSGNASAEYTVGEEGDTTSEGQVVVARIPYAGTDYAPWAYSSQIVVWRATSGQLFHQSTVADVAADGTIGDSYAFGATGHNPWHIFASNQSAYSAPGATLVFDEAGYNNNSDAQFAPMTFGGMWVRALQAENTPYVITDNKTDGTNRQVELGAAGESTYFKFDESFTFDRNSATKVLGTATVEIASGKTFTINAREGKGAVVESGNTLVLKGAGTLAVTGGLTVNGTLDLSEATRPTIDGDVGLYGTIVLPAGTEVSSESPFTVCSGTLSGLNVFVKIGDAEAVEKSMTISGGTITALGEPQYIFYDNYPTVVPAGKTYTFVGGDSAENTVVVDALDVNGTLKTQGYLSFTNYKSNGSTLDVESGSLTLHPGNNWFNGTLTVESGATFVNALEADAVQYGGTFIANIYGTLDMGATRWSLGSNNTINLYEGCTVTGSGQGENGTFDWIGGTLNAYGDVSLQAPIKIRDGSTANINADTTDQKGLTLAGTIGPGTLVKKGAGLVKFTTNPAYAITVENGAFTFAVDATPTITYSAKPGTGTTMSMWYAQQSTWKGTVVIGDLNAPAALPLDAYGNANSKIVLTGTTGSCYLNGTTTVAAELVVGTNATNVVEFNNGSSGQVGTFNKVSGPGTLKLVGWGGCSAATYVVNTDNFTGTLNIHNAITRDGGGTFTIRIGNIVTTGATTPGSKVLNLEQTVVENETGTVVYNLDNAQVNGVAANLEVKSDGIYVKTPVALITSADGQTATPYYDSIATAFASVAEGETLTLVGSAVTLSDDVTVSASYTLAGDAEGTTVTGAGKIYLTGTAELTLDATLTSVGNQFWFSSHDAKLTFPTGKSVNVRPYTAGGCQTGTIDNGDGTTTYYQYVLLQLQVGASNVTLAYYGSGDPLVTKQINEGDIIVFTATPAEGYENPVVTVNGTPLAPEDGKYTVVVGTVNVSISATASAASSDTYEVSGETEIGEDGSFTVPEGTTKVKVGDYTLENGDGITIDGTTVTVLAPEVVEEAEKEAIVIDDDNDEVTLNVDLVPGLYYGVGVATSLDGGVSRPDTLTQFDGTNEGDILTVAKPEGDKGFFKVFVDIKE